MSEKRAAPKLLKSRRGRQAWIRAGRGPHKPEGSLRGSGSGRALATLTPSSGPRPITVSPGARATRGPPSRGCSSKPPDMAARTRPLRKDTVPAVLSAFQEQRGAWTGPGKAPGGVGAGIGRVCQVLPQLGPSDSAKSRLSTPTSDTTGDSSFACTATIL